MNITEVLAKSGASYRQVDYWRTQGWITDIPTSIGSGNRIDWTEEHLRQIKRLKIASDLYQIARDEGLLRFAEEIDKIRSQNLHAL